MKPLITSTRLADGRELLYFDETAQNREDTDTRPLERRRDADTGQIRYDALTGDWVAIAQHRGSRTYLPPANQCPLCPSTAENPSEIPASDYDVAVFENRFPSLGPALGEAPESPGWGTLSTAFGRCEVVAFSSEHQGSFGTLSAERAHTVLSALAQRTGFLNELPGIKQVFAFENRGKDIGVTLHHPHGQIYAYPYLTPRAEVMAKQALQHHQQTGRYLLADVLRSEQDAADRMIYQGQHFSAYVPFAAHWPLEIHLTPHRQVADLSELNDQELEELAPLSVDLLHRLDLVYDSPTPYIAAWHQAPLEPNLRATSRLHLQITSPRRAADKLKYLAGSEAAMGAFINDSSPEQIAKTLREAAL
ncbi:galactose-1-phosphate uridylyltransferase [Psychromicrobium lacuslunae]|uniref:Galactose-1-phosphate uridylyltransferase n=1 Tax=Psychromicrobium lacuslunae TaxID=1618207 RepID=A0A0D4BVD5_9MICC|nr:galactose-1-phosphate uridylyltransferase [Psychromicrobium lacuslunae]AJT40402.1 galactose-1-phosphate uridylyltransferase [Psychromicrobium lacuslunae]